MQRGRVDSDRGDTLVEVLISVVILGIAGAAIMAGLALTARVSGVDRGQSSSATYVRNFGEAISKTVSSGGYNASGIYSWTPPSGTVVITSAKCLTKASATTTSPNWVTCPSDGNAQILALNSTAPNGTSETLTIVVRKPCTGASAGDTC